MKWKVIPALILIIGSISWQAKNLPLINLNTFTSIPKDLMGAGEGFYLSAKDKKESKFICTTDYETALIYINQKPIRLKVKDAAHFNRNKQIFIYEKYALMIIGSASKKVGDENYLILKGTLTLKYDSNVVWEKKIIGEGGD